MIRKKSVFTCVFIAVLVLGFTATVQADDDDKMKGRSCDPAGLWFGFPLGQPPFKVVSIIPIEGGKKRYILAAEDQDPTQTPFRGEMVKVKKNLYKLWGMQYIALAPETYGYMVISGEWSLSNCNMAEGDYLVSLYASDPFHDEAAVPFMSLPVLNLYERMPVIDDSSGF